MAELSPDRRVQVEAVDWRTLLPFTYLFRSFRMAIGPGKLLLALALLLGLFLSGELLDLIWGDRVYIQLSTQTEEGDNPRWSNAVGPEGGRTAETVEIPGEFVAYLRAPNATQFNDLVGDTANRREHVGKQYDETVKQWKERVKTWESADQATRGDKPERPDRDEFHEQNRVARIGVFDTILNVEQQALSLVIAAALDLSIGFGNLTGDFTAPAGGAAPAGPPNRPGVIGGLRIMLLDVPLWLWHAHPWYLVVYGLIAVLLWALFGGAIARIAAVQAARDDRLSPLAALRFAARRLLWLIAAPALPAVVILLILLALAVGGWMFFNVPGLDIIGALLFVLFLLGGLIAAVLLVGLLIAGGLLYPSLAAEGTDAFDAVSRSFNYVFGRPWQWALYTAVLLVYGAIAFVVVTFVIDLSLDLTYDATEIWVANKVPSQKQVDDDPELAERVYRFQALWSPDQVTSFEHDVSDKHVSWTGETAGWIIGAWKALLLMLLPAFVITFCISGHTLMYLLLRRSADGTDVEEVYQELPRPPAAPPEKVEPGPAAPAAEPAPTAQEPAAQEPAAEEPAAEEPAEGDSGTDDAGGDADGNDNKQG